MDAARKWRLRAERYRAFAALAGDSDAQQTRLCRAQHFDRLADKLEGRAPAPSAPLPHPATPFAALRRVIARLTAGAS